MGDIFLPTVLFVILTSAYLWLVWKFPPAIFLANITYSAITKIVSCFYMEINTIYLIEMGTYSGPTGGTVRQLFHHVFIYAGALFVVRKYLPNFWSAERQQFTPPSRSMLRRLMLVVGALCAIQLLNVMFSDNIPLFTGTSRQLFWNYHIRFPILRDLLGVLMVFVPCIASYGLGVGWALRDNRMAGLSLAVIALYFGFLLISGQKFNGLMVGVFLVAGPFYIISRAAGRKISIGKWGVRGGIAVALALVAGAIGFGDRAISQQQGGVVAGIVYRAFAMQGSVYYVADRNAERGETVGLSVMYGDRDEIIRALVPPALAKRYIYAGVNLAGSLPGNSTLALGFWVTIIVCLLYGLFLGFATYLIIKRILEGKVFQILLLSYIYVWIVSAYSGGTFVDIIDLKFWVFSIAIVIIEVWGRLRKRGKIRPRQVAARSRERASGTTLAEG